MTAKKGLKKILIVEDDKTSAALLSKMVEAFGYLTMDIVATGEEAIKKAGQLLPDLVLMDIILGGDIDGIEAAGQIYQQYNLPVVYLTVSTDDETVERAKKTMPFGYILKPYNKNMLHVTLEMALYKYEVEKKLKETEKRNNDLLSSIPDIMFTLNCDGSFAHDVEAEIAKRIWPKKVSDVALSKIKNVCQTKEQAIFEYKLKKSGETYYYEARIIASSKDRVLVIVRDNSEKKEAEIELNNYKKNLEKLVEERTSELLAAHQSLETEVDRRVKIGHDLRIFSHAIEQSPNVVVFFDKDGIVQYVNTKFSELSGFKPDEVIGSNVNKAGNHVIPEAEIWNEIIKVKKWDGEIYNIDKENEIYYVQAYVTSIKDDKKEISHYILVAEDITERKKEELVIEDIKQSLDSSKKEKLDLEMDWRDWKEKMLSRNVSRTDKSLFRNINNSFTQGAGFGTMISLLEMLSGSAKKDDGNYLVDASIFDLILENVRISQNAFKTFSNIDWIISNDFELESVSFMECVELIKAAVNDANKLTSVNKHKILVNETQKGNKGVIVNINRDYFYKAVYELLINALKFSKRGTFIALMVSVVNQYLVISTINDPEKTDEGIVGIPPEYEKVVFEPFYRLTKNVYEQYKTLDFGLGLTLVEKIINKHGGEVIVENIRDHSDLKREPLIKVDVTISLPLVKK